MLGQQLSRLFCGLSILFLSCFCYAFARLFIDALWSPAGKGLTFWLSFLMSYSEVVIFPLVSWVRCGDWLYWILILALFLTFIMTCFFMLFFFDEHLSNGDGEQLICILCSHFDVESICVFWIVTFDLWLVAYDIWVVTCVVAQWIIAFFSEWYNTCLNLSGDSVLEQGCYVLVTILEIVLKRPVDKTNIIDFWFSFYIVCNVTSGNLVIWNIIVLWNHMIPVLRDSVIKVLSPQNTTSHDTFEIYLVKRIVSCLFSELLFPFFPKKKKTHCN